jgi:hypothetical protein
MVAEAAELVAFFAGLSARSLFLRFHGFREVDADLVESFLAPDWAERGALVGRLAERDGPGGPTRRRISGSSACR